LHIGSLQATYRTHTPVWLVHALWRIGLAQTPVVPSCCRQLLQKVLHPLTLIGAWAPAGRSGNADLHGHATATSRPRNLTQSRLSSAQLGSARPGNLTQSYRARSHGRIARTTAHSAQGASNLTTLSRRASRTAPTTRRTLANRGKTGCTRAPLQGKRDRLRTAQVSSLPRLSCSDTKKMRNSPSSACASSAD